MALSVKVTKTNCSAAFIRLLFGIELPTCSFEREAWKHVLSLKMLERRHFEHYFLFRESRGELFHGLKEHEDLARNFEFIGGKERRREAREGRERESVERLTRIPVEVRTRHYDAHFSSYFDL